MTRVEIKEVLGNEELGIEVGEEGDDWSVEQGAIGTKIICGSVC